MSHPGVARVLANTAAASGTINHGNINGGAAAAGTMISNSGSVFISFDKMAKAVEAMTK